MTGGVADALESVEPALPAGEAGVARRHIELSGLTRDFGTGAPAVDRLDLEIAAGEFVGLLGPSGCGKTTTLRMIAGLVEPTAGSIVVSGRDITRELPWARNLGLVFQSYALFPHLSVTQNVAFGLRLRRVSRADMRRRVGEALRLVRLEGLEHRRPRELSGGQQQRVAIARALVIEPDILLLDEPLSNLDAKLRVEMRNEIRDIQRKTGITTIFVTHDQEEALTLCDRIAVMREGRLEQAGTPVEIYEHPATPFVAGFIGRINTIPCTIEVRGGVPRLAVGEVTLPAPPELPRMGPANAMVRPHVVEVKPDGYLGLPGTVVRRTFAGNVVEAEIDCGVAAITAEIRPNTQEDRLAALGARVAVGWAADKTIVFEA